MPPVAPAAPKKSKKTLIVIAAVVIVVALVAVVVLIGMQQHGAWDPKPGDYVQYTISGGGHTGTAQMTIKSVGLTTVTVTTTMSFMGSSTSEDSVVSKNTAFGSDYDLNHLPSGMTLARHGTDTISTPWADRVADHYTGTMSVQGQTMGIDMWVWKDVLLRMDMHVNGVPVIMTIAGTNLPIITTP
jgi:hypothetical protein